MLAKILNESTIPIYLSLVALLISFFSYQYSKNQSKIERAVDLAKDYAILLHNITAVRYIISSHENIAKLINKHQIVCAEDSFDMDQLKNVYTPNELKSLEEFFSGTLMDTQVLANHYVMSHTTPMVSGKEEEQKLTLLNPDLLKHHYATMIQVLLNDLEQFSMNFVQNLADSDTVYQSLHQSFFYCFGMLYYPICKNNLSSKDKYYTNIIYLYKNWKEKECKIEQKLNKNQNKKVKQRQKDKKFEDKVLSTGKRL